MNVLRAAACATLCGPLCAVGAGACGEALPGKARTIEGVNYTVAFKTLPDPIQAGAHFALDFTVCPRASAPAPRTVRVDAHMPEHRHGMNYRPAVTARPDAMFRAEGLLFHMPGRWDVTFDVDAGSRVERLTGTLQID